MPWSPAPPVHDPRMQPPLATAMVYLPQSAHMLGPQGASVAAPLRRGPAPLLNPMSFYVPESLTPAQRLARDCEYQPRHHRNMLAFLSHSANRLWSVSERLQRTCLRKALLDWRDLSAQERLDGRLQPAAAELRSMLSHAKKLPATKKSQSQYWESGPDEVHMLERRLQALRRARGAGRGGVCLLRPRRGGGTSIQGT